MKALEVQPVALIQRLKEELEQLEELKPPHWSRFVKTGAHKERVPDQPDWWHIRAASILRRLYIDGPVGVSRLRTYYGGRQNRGQPPEHFRKGGGKIIRTLLQQLEKAGLTTRTGKGGRKLTPKGIELLEKKVEEIKSG
jgi:small subunit ribosomal protein S19e